MKIVNYHQLPPDGFAGVRMREIVKDDRLFGINGGSPHASGIGNLVYIADATFIPNGETRMHPHKEIDVVTIILKGRIMHKGSLGNNQMLNAHDVQIQRAGSAGFIHNEINPDPEHNKMLQIWLLPEQLNLAPEYRVYDVKPGSVKRVYGGPPNQGDVLPAKTSVDIVRLEKDSEYKIDDQAQIYVAEGKGQMDAMEIESGDLIEMNSFHCKAHSECTLVVICFVSPA
jgi:redox-sensitive bicupin YhaK (pirin superfamily)